METVLYQNMIPIKLLKCYSDWPSNIGCWGMQCQTCIPFGTKPITKMTTGPQQLKQAQELNTSASKKRYKSCGTQEILY